MTSRRFGIAGDNSGRGGGFEAFEFVGIRDDDGLDVLNDIAAGLKEDFFRDFPKEFARFRGDVSDGDRLRTAHRR